MISVEKSPSMDVFEFCVFPFLCCRELATCAVVNSEFARVAGASERLREVLRMLSRNRLLHRVHRLTFQELMKLPDDYLQTTDYVRNPILERRRLLVCLAKHGELELSEQFGFPSETTMACFAFFGRYWKIADLLKKNNSHINTCLGVCSKDNQSICDQAAKIAFLLGTSTKRSIVLEHMTCTASISEENVCQSMNMALYFGNVRLLRALVRKFGCDIEFWKSSGITAQKLAIIVESL